MMVRMVSEDEARNYVAGRHPATRLNGDDLRVVAVAARR